VECTHDPTAKSALTGGAVAISIADSGAASCVETLISRLMTFFLRHRFDALS
jgi:hypothetical protein